jgi:sugar lactone lactonase YvrE
MAFKDPGLKSIIILSATGGLVLLLFLFIMPGLSEKPGTDNPYEYNLGELTKIPAEKIGYAKTGFIATGMENPKAMAIDGQDTLYVSGDARITVFGPQGGKESSFRLPENASCIAVDGSGTLYAGFRNGIVLFDLKGNKKDEWVDLGVQALLTSLCAAGDSLFAADAGNAMVYRFDKSGKLVRNFTNPGSSFVIPSPYFDVAYRSEDTIWIVNPGKGKITLFNAQGEKTSEIGFPSNALDGFGGCCNPAHIALLKDGSIVTAEKGIARVKVYDVKGKIITVVAGPEEFGEGTLITDLAVSGRDSIYVLDSRSKGVRIFGKKQG